MYKKIDQNDIKYLKSLFEEGYALFGNEISKDYAHDELGTVSNMPDALLFVRNASEVSKVLKYANDNLIPVTVRGSGTGLVGACVPLNGGIMIDTTKMNHILELDENNLTLTVEPGVLLMEIYEYVEPKGYFYAPDPGEKTATIGGNISTNAGGMRAVKYGTTRDWVRAIEVVLPDGSIETFGRKVVKDSTGYSLKKLVICSEGTLCVITKAILKLIPKPTETISLLVPFETQEKALGQQITNKLQELKDKTKSDTISDIPNAKTQVLREIAKENVSPEKGVVNPRRSAADKKVIKAALDRATKSLRN